MPSSNARVFFSTDMAVLPPARGPARRWIPATAYAARGPLRPFVGVNVGGVYGDRVSDTFAAGLEAGAKFYVQPRTFVYAMVEYGWFFEDSDDVDDKLIDAAAKSNTTVNELAEPFAISLPAISQGTQIRNCSTSG